MSRGKRFVRIELDPDDADGLAGLLEGEGHDKGFRELAADIREQIAEIDAEWGSEYPSNIGDTCCGSCPGDTCYVDQITGER